MQDEGAGSGQKHRAVSEEVFQQAGPVQFAAVEGVEKLEEHEQGEQDGAHFRFGRAQEVEDVLAQKDGGHVEGGADDAPEHGGGYDVFVAADRFAVHEVVVSGFQSEGQGRRAVHDDVDPEQIQGGERRFQAHEDGREHDDDGREVDGELEGDEPLEVFVDVAAPFDGAGDGGKRVVQKDDVAGFLGDFGAGDAHGDADVGVFQGRGVVDAVARFFQQFDDAHFDDRGASRDDGDRRQFRQKLFVAHIGDVFRFDGNAAVVQQVQFAGDGRGGDDVVSREDFQGDAGRTGRRHGRRRAAGR